MKYKFVFIKAEDPRESFKKVISEIHEAKDCLTNKNDYLMIRKDDFDSLDPMLIFRLITDGSILNIQHLDL